METRFSDSATRLMALSGAIAWLVLAIAWQASNTLERSRDWEGLPQAMFFVGLIGLLIGGMALGVMALDPMGPVQRPKWRVGGLALLAIGLVLSIILGWAVPLWTAAYGLAMLSLAWSGALRVEGWIIGGALSAASVSFFALTALEVGAVDSYGDYPVAWMTATWLAGLGSAAGLLLQSRSLRSGRGAAAASRS